ncbi:hypothetical protein SISNIDRAFT_488307 [Sistotremastrum niveocremeum HHB9708]|uniref:F-box domain-containing protein n=1 Tax=Sistotremastrum niveocremeum HHB9708 TaxID=1314777 RepID=A0A164RBM9_9AGAM|nr:hypothetical protein SISNIDRAFT_488307 [Sistotremastrum niveocremeum HHB9708]
MPFNAFPNEIIHEIFVEYAADGTLYKKPTDRLTVPLRVSQIDRRTRYVALQCRPLWRLIYGYWPSAAREAFMERAGSRRVTMILDTKDEDNMKDEPDDLDKLHRFRWADFITRNIEAFLNLEIKIHTPRSLRALAPALATPSPNLVSCSITFCKERQSDFMPRTFFSLQAPKLQNAVFRTSLFVDVKKFQSLTAVTLEIERSTSRRIILALHGMPKLERVMLIGTLSHNDLPEYMNRRTKEPLTMSFSCRDLTLRNMMPYAVNRFLKNVQLPSMHRARIHETMISEDLDFVGEVVGDGQTNPNTIGKIFMTVPTYLHHVQSLSITLRPTNYEIKVEGNIQCHYKSDWTAMDPTITNDPRVFETIACMIESLYVELGKEPDRLTINDGILHGQEPKALSGLNRILLWRRVFQCYHQVVHLKMTGCSETLIPALHMAANDLPLLATLDLGCQLPADNEDLISALSEINDHRDIEINFV